METASAPSKSGRASAEGWRRMFSALRNPNYRYFYIGQSVSLIGTWTRSAALGWVAFQAARSQFLLGLVFTLNSLPLFLFVTYAGALADRIPKIRIFEATSWFALCSSLALALMLFHGPVHIGYLMVFATLWGTAMAFEMPARQTLMVDLVGKDDLVNAIALNSAMVNSTRVIGPAIGGALLATVGSAWCFLVDALSYLAVLYAISRIRLPPEHYARRRERGGLRHALEGFGYLKTNPSIAEAIALLFVMGLGGWAYQSQMSAFAVTQLKMGAGGYGRLLVFNGAGACAAAMLVAAGGERLLGARVLYAGTAMFSAFIALFGAAHRALPAEAALFFAGFGIILFFSVGNSLVQTQSPDRLRGRIMGIWALAFGGGMPVGSFWLGLLASRTSSGFALQAGGTFCALGALAVFSFFRLMPGNARQNE